MEVGDVSIPTAWEDAASEIANKDPGVVVVCGPKNSGKSTFSRYLLNFLIPSCGKVGYLETDVGQPEFVPPGCLALNVTDEPILDLANTMLRTPERCYFYGDISSKRDPKLYLDCIFNLYRSFMESYSKNTKRKTPLIVNTPGWVKGNGFELLVEILRS